MENINVVFKFSMLNNKKNIRDLEDIKSMIKDISESYSFSSDNSKATASPHRAKKVIIGKMVGGLTKAQHAFNCIKELGPLTSDEADKKYFAKNKIECDVSASLSNAKTAGWLEQKMRGGVWSLSEKGKKMNKFIPKEKSS